MRQKCVRERGHVYSGDASLNNMLDSVRMNYDPDALCRYAREVMEELDIPELASFISELSDIEVME